MNKITKNKNKKNNIYFYSIIYFFISASIASAQKPTFKELATGYGCTGDDCIINPISANNLMELITDILAIIASLSVPIIVIMIIYSGFLFFSAQGEPGKITEAKKTLTWAVVGGVIIVSAYALYLLIQNLLTSL